MAQVVISRYKSSQPTYEELKPNKAGRMKGKNGVLSLPMRN